MTKRVDPDLAAARDADLDASGLSDARVKKKLGVTNLLDENETAELVAGMKRGTSCLSYEIPYFELSGKIADFSRWKVIYYDGEDHDLRYYQHPGTIPRMYFPPLVDWQAIATDPRRRIVITEGEKKAACATLMGIPCIGLGGVWNWKSKKWNYDEVPDFEGIEWKGRTVEICYDSDMSTNEDVRKAQNALTHALVKRGAKVFTRVLPASKGKTALDDFLVARGADAYEELTLNEADPSRELHTLSERLVYVKQNNAFLSVDDGQILRGREDVERMYGTTSMIGEGGKPVSVASQWIRWPHRREIQRMTYAPGRAQFFEDSYNTWRGWGAVSKRGDVSQFLDVIQSLENWQWFLQWLAYPIQHPGAKMFTSALIWSVKTGTGKSFIGEVMQHVYGEANSSFIDSDDLHDNSNDWIAGKQFVHADEVALSATRSDMGVLKSMITGKHVRVKIKYVPVYSLPNVANFFFTSNQPDAIRLELEDRRFFVSKLDLEKPEAWWNKLDRWLRREGGAAAWRHYLEERVDCSKFNPHGRAPETVAKAEMQVETMSSLDRACYEFLQDPDGYMGVDHKLVRGRDVATAEQFATFLTMGKGAHHFEENSKYGRPSLNMISRAMQKAGAVKPSFGPLRTEEGMRRLLAFRNLDKWKAHIGNHNSWRENFEKRAVRASGGDTKVVEIGKKRGAKT